MLREANVVGMTTTGAAKYRNVLRQLKPRIVLVEEAAEILEQHVLTALGLITLLLDRTLLVALFASPTSSS